MAGESGRLVILSGPSCVGKSPLDKALARFYPDLHAARGPGLAAAGVGDLGGGPDGLEVGLGPGLGELHPDDVVACVGQEGHVQRLAAQRHQHPRRLPAGQQVHMLDQVAVHLVGVEADAVLGPALLPVVGLHHSPS